MEAFKLAYRNLVGAGLRTWLNVIVLSAVYVLIIWHYGLLDGWNIQARIDSINWDIAGGHYYHENYDPYDIFTLDDAHAEIPVEFREAEEKGEVEPVLVSQGSIYPEGRIQTVLLKGIDPAQDLIELPAASLDVDIEEIPAIIGTSMARNSKLETGDFVTVRWRDVDGTFDAAEIKIMDVFKTNVPRIDGGQLWIPIGRLQEMKQMPGQATYLITAKDADTEEQVAGWEFQDQDKLLYDIELTIKSKRVGGSIFYIILMLLAMLAVFDTQVLSIFRRQKEIGTYVALGMTKGQVIRLFTVEGAMHAVLAALFGAVWGIPFLAWQANTGFAMPAGSEGYGMAMAERLYPAYSMGLVLTTVLLIMSITTLVSYMPSRKIAKMKPTDAIRGKLQ